MCEHVVGSEAEQCLQQFVNQSTWKWEPVRASLSLYVAGLVRPRAWDIREVVFPKNGSNSVGVARQYAPSAGRVLNCQLGLSVFFVGDQGSSPVNWRLLLPECWDGDESRRRRTRLPDTERHQPRWRYLLDVVDELVLTWDLAPAPLLIDAADEYDVGQQLRGLEERGLHYVVQISPNAPVSSTGTRPPPSPARRGLAAGELVAHAVRAGANTVDWRLDSDRHNERTGTPTRFVTVPLPVGSEAGRQRGPRHLLALWPAGRKRPSAIWLTNLAVTRLHELGDLLALRSRTTGDLRRLQDEVGLRHFEGRSYIGWHHHVTLVSMAHAFAVSRAQRVGANPAYAR
jgi:SRSO17 transposase